MPKTRKRALAAVCALLVLALVGAVVGGAMWAVAALGNDTPFGNADAVAQREQFLADATQAAMSLTTVTPDETDAMIANIQSASTGGLAADLEDASVREQLANDIKARGVTQIPTVVSISASKLDADAGSGQALVFIAQTVTGDTGESVLRRQGISLDLAQVDGVWKVSTMSQLFEGFGTMPGATLAPADPDATATDPGVSTGGSAPAAENPAGS